MTGYSSRGAWLDADQGALLPWPTLTRREMEVAWYIRLSYTNDQIAQTLGISTSTVKSHVHNLLTKFQLPSRWALRDVLNEIDFHPPA
jgi:DNA-binding CsgD family transcriptional regulator